MAFTVTPIDTVFGNKRTKLLKITADGAEANGINVAALLEGGLIQQSANETPKPAKTNSKNTPKD